MKKGLGKSNRNISLYVVFIAVMFISFGCYGQTNGVLEGTDITVNSDAGIYSKYIWRGFKLDSDPVMQPGIYVGIKELTIGIWGSMDIDAEDALNSDEIDYIIDYTHEFEKFSISVGHTYYDFPPGDTFSREFYIGFGLNTILSPTLTWYEDYGDEDSGGGNGSYVVLGLSHSFPLGDSPVNLDLSGHVGYNNELFITGEGGDTLLSAGLTVPLAGKITFNPNINYSIPFGDLKDSEDGNQDEEFYYGFTLTFDF